MLVVELTVLFDTHFLPLILASLGSKMPENIAYVATEGAWV